MKRRIIAAIQRHESKLEVIVGKGLHSKNGIAKLKPAVEELCNESGFKSYIDPKNTGVLVINLQNARIPQSWGNIDPLVSANVQQSYPQQAYQPQQQPQYQQQQYQQHNNYNQQQQYHNNNNNNSQTGLIVKVLVALCICLKNNIR